MSQDEAPKLHIEGDWKAKVEADDAAEAEKPALQVDADWKAQAQAEKARLAEETEAKAEQRGADGAGGLPPADFRGLIGFLTQQAVSGLGVMGDPESGRVMIDLEGSHYWIDLLQVLGDKTKGNLSEEEEGELTQILTELRSRYVQISQLVAQQAAEKK
jgi:hypothetical protein